MSISQERKEVYLAERENKLSNKLNGIPLFYTFPKIGSIIHSIPKGYPVLWSANSGVGKTQSWIGIFVYSIYKLRKEHPELNLKVKLIITLLEDTKGMFIDRLFSMLLNDMFNIKVDIQDLHSLKENALSEDVIQKLDAVQTEVDFILEDCEINDSVYNPTGVYKWARAISNKYGQHHNKIMLFTGEDGKTFEQEVYSHYTLTNPDMQFLMIVDNLNNLAQETRAGSLMTERETINMWTRTYCRLQVTKHWNWSVINIIQQASDSEASAYHQGRLIVERVKPSLSGLGNSKESQRDHFIVFGLFAPNRHGLTEYEGYDISLMRDNFRSLIVLKSNISKTNVEIPLFFDGSCSLIRELPKPSERIELNKVYEYIKNRSV